MVEPQERTFRNPQGAPRVTARVADGFRLRLRGLMFRKCWPEGWEGLYFPDCSVVHTGWMRLRPDLVFLDDRGRVTGVIHSAGRWRIFRGPPGSRHTLELPEGALSAAGIRPGETLA